MLFLPYKTISYPWLYIHFRALKCSSSSFGEPGLYFWVSELFSIWLELIGREYEVFPSSRCMLVGHTELCSVHHWEQSGFHDCFCMPIFENISIFLWINISFFLKSQISIFQFTVIAPKKKNWMRYWRQSWILICTVSIFLLYSECMLHVKL